MRRLLALLTAGLVVAACGGGSATPVHSPTPLAAGVPGGLIAYSATAGIGVLDPGTGKSTILAPFPAGGAFRASGPVWGPAPNLDHPVIYFTVHDDRPAENRTTAGVEPYDWLFRLDPFTGVLDPMAASFDPQSEGPIGLVANQHYLAMTMGCCASYEVDAFDLTQPLGPTKILSRPPAQAPFFTEGIAPGTSGLVAVRQFGSGTWYWLNADAGVLNPFPLATLGTDDGPIAITADGTMVAVAMPDHGAIVEPISLTVPIAPPSGSAAAGGSPAATASASPSAHATPSAAAPHHVDSRLPHPDGLAWSPDAKQLALAVNGEVDLYSASAPDGTAPAGKYLAGAGVLAVSWSGPVVGRTATSLKPAAGPQAMVDALLAATRLPSAADTPANRPFTKIYIWQFDSSRTSPIATIADATPAILAKYPPLAAGVAFHHWAASDSWALLGGCYRYRVVVTGSIPPVASTVGLQTSALCFGTKAGPSPSPSA